ncbi:MAG: hypothetical protein JXR49_05145 [Acidobacteria bacterium]|nr:hypothetical protein [Acidobacteriota bacterium]
MNALSSETLAEIQGGAKLACVTYTIAAGSVSLAGFGWNPMAGLAMFGFLMALSPC